MLQKLQNCSRRKFIGAMLGGAAAVSLGACAETVNPGTGQVTLGLSPQVLSFIQNAVAATAKYAPTVESIAATAAGLFGAQYAAIVVAGSNAVNQVISALVNITASLSPAASSRLRRMGARMRALLSSSSGTLVGYTTVVNQATGVRTTIPVFAQ